MLLLIPRSEVGAQIFYGGALPKFEARISHHIQRLLLRLGGQHILSQTQGALIPQVSRNCRIVRLRRHSVLFLGGVKLSLLLGKLELPSLVDR
jgi:hypothetical protein